MNSTKKSRMIPGSALATIFSFISFKDLLDKIGKLSKNDRAIITNHLIQKAYDFPVRKLVISYKKNQKIPKVALKFLV